MPRYFAMTIDKSLRVKSGANKQRNVWTRAERVAKLMKMEKWTPESSAIGMPKVRVEKFSMKKKKKVKKEGEEDAAATPAKK
jgi:small basic protein (TIGR04137 family)